MCPHRKGRQTDRVERLKKPSHNRTGTMVGVRARGKEESGRENRGQRARGSSYVPLWI